jgi:general secretion pathway protein A
MAAAFTAGVGALMYESFFGLRERPFDLTPNPRFLVLTEVHREALSNIEYGIASGRGVTVLIGEAGTGKTTLIRAALQRQVQQVHSVHVANPALTRGEFIELLAVRFELSDHARSSKTAMLLELEDVLRARHARGETSVLIIDEAQSVPRDLLEELRLLGNIETEDAKLLSIVLAGQPELAALLNDESLRQLKQRIALRCELRPLTQAETAGYLAGRVRAAGGMGAHVFTREAVMLIHERSRGIPRTVSVIADNALLTAFALRHKPVTTSIVNEVCRDLCLEPAPPTADELPPPAQNAAAPPRVLALEHPQPHEAAGGALSSAAQEDTPMFTSVYPKRRRFSLFSKSGSK